MSKTSKKTQVLKSGTGASCPECGAAVGQSAQRSPSKDAVGPWREVLKVYLCDECKNTIPAHLWERWNGLTLEDAKKEWRSKYKENKQAEEDAFKKAISLLENHQIETLETHCEESLKLYPTNVELWKLLGVAYGGLEEPTKARKAFLQALTLASSDPITLANYVTSCFHVGDKESACNGIEAFFDDLDDEGKSIVLDSLLEAVKSGLMKESDLPSKIFGKDGPDKGESSLFETVVNGVKLVYKSVDVISGGHGYMIVKEPGGTMVAYLEGYRFNKSKPIVIEILGPTSKEWARMGISYESGILKVRAAMESMVDRDGTINVNVKRKLTPGFKIVGGF